VDVPAPEVVVAICKKNSLITITAFRICVCAEGAGCFSKKMRNTPSATALFSLVCVCVKKWQVSLPKTYLPSLSECKCINKSKAPNFFLQKITKYIVFFQNRLSKSPVFTHLRKKCAKKIFRD
jgi:hypothetical protein